jgi:hypothetical protein
MNKIECVFLSPITKKNGRFGLAFFHGVFYQCEEYLNEATIMVPICCDEQII